VTDQNGIAQRGVLLRHLVMPEGVAGTRDVMDWIARELGTETYVNIMPQYYPAGRVSGTEYEEISRRLSPHEFQEALREARVAGLYRLDGRSAGRVSVSVSVSGVPTLPPDFGGGGDSQLGAEAET
jgi:putative pyruvate formate lyase activating enzyme